jgi:chemotaxis protein MotA
MDIMTGVGLVFGIIIVATMMLMGGDLHLFVSEHAAIIVIGGSIAATMIRFRSALSCMVCRWERNLHSR